MPLTPDGYDAKRAAEWLDQIRNEYESRTGLTLDYDRDEFITQITAIMADRLAEVSQSAQSLYDTFDPANAEGKYLDVLAGLVGLRRQRATPSTVELVLSGDNGKTVPEGSEVKDSQDRTWIANSDISISSNNEGTGIFSAATEGSLQLAAGEIDTANDKGFIVTPVSGWDSAYNPESATPGRDRESDAELRQRRQQSLQVVGAAAVPAIRASLVEEIDEVTSSVVVDNYEITSRTLSTGQTLPPKSVTVFVWPDDTSVSISASEYRSKIASKLAELVPAGIESVGNISEDVELADGYLKPFSWYWVTVRNVDVEVRVTLYDEYTLTSSLKSEIEDEVLAYFEDIDVGEDVFRLPVVGRLSKLEELKNAVVRFAYQGNTTDESQLSIDRDRIAEMNSINIHT